MTSKAITYAPYTSAVKLAFRPMDTIVPAASELICGLSLIYQMYINGNACDMFDVEKLNCRAFTGGVIPSVSCASGLLCSIVGAGNCLHFV